MWTWIKSLFYVCHHKWEIISTATVYSNLYRGDNELPIRIDYTLQCKNCGDIKIRKA